MGKTRMHRKLQLGTTAPSTPSSIPGPSHPGELMCYKWKVLASVSWSVQQSFSCFVQWVSLPWSLCKPHLKLPQIKVLVTRWSWCKKSILDPQLRSSLTVTGRKGNGKQEARHTPLVKWDFTALKQKAFGNRELAINHKIRWITAISSIFTMAVRKDTKH